MSPLRSTTFWDRMGLKAQHHDACISALERLYPQHRLEELVDQGYCSFTILSTRKHSLPGLDERLNNDSLANNRNEQHLESFIVQIRPEQHALDLSIASVAKEIYGPLAPVVRTLQCILPPGLQAFELERLRGTTFARLQQRTRSLGTDAGKKQDTLVKSFASCMARAWTQCDLNGHVIRRCRADSAIDDSSNHLFAQCRGRVGVKITRKVEELAQILPDEWLRRRAEGVLSNIEMVERLPVVLNHGDLIPSNILINPETWAIQGLVDWAEAEWLPFGTCFYGLEHLLGYFDTSEATNHDFVYYDETPRLRRLFWDQLKEEAPMISKYKEEISLARDLGVLLWYGYAWDDGAIDRPVNDADDREELECLRSFLSAA